MYSVHYFYLYLCTVTDMKYLVEMRNIDTCACQYTLVQCNRTIERQLVDEHVLKFNLFENTSLKSENIAVF